MSSAAPLAKCFDLKKNFKHLICKKKPSQSFTISYRSIIKRGSLFSILSVPAAKTCICLYFELLGGTPVKKAPGMLRLARQHLDRNFNWEKRGFCSLWNQERRPVPRVAKVFLSFSSNLSICFSILLKRPHWQVFFAKTKILLKFSI